MNRNRAGHLLVDRLGLAGRSRASVVSDLVLWAVLAVVMTLLSLTTERGDHYWWQLAGGLLALGVAIGLARGFPVLALLITATLNALTLLYLLPMFVMSYLVGRWLARARPALLAFAAIAVAGSVTVRLATSDVTAWFAVVGILLFAGLFPWLVGRYWRQYQELVFAGWERAEHLEREQRIIADQERLRERSRIAQDMHDSLGHELSLIALRAGALEVASDLTDRDRAAAAELRTSAAAATERLREIIGVLRDESDPVPLEPSGDTIDELVQRARASGMDVTLEHARGQLDPAGMVGRAAYRVVQEALTNATKHAPGAAVTVRLDHDASGTTVAVLNARPPASQQPAQPSGNRGLVGLRERVRLVGGALVAEPRDGGFAVVARLPDPGTASVADAEPGPPQSESAHRLANARRRVRRDLIRAIAVPVVIGAALGVAMLGYYAKQTAGSVLTPSEYATLAVGQSRANVERALPQNQLGDLPLDGEPLPPANTSCRYYRSSGNLFARLVIYRLCFAGDRLVAKTTLVPGDSAGWEVSPSPAAP